MDDEDKVFESIRVLLQSVKQLSDRFLEADARLTSSHNQLACDLSNLAIRLEQIERSLLHDGNTYARSENVTLVPSASEPESAISTLPPINLSLKSILDAYASTPILLEPFSYPCGVNARTLNGEIDQVELEMYQQGLFWALSTVDNGWILLPRPGSLQRRFQLESLERLFEIQGLPQLPALLHLVRPSQADTVVHGRRWQLRQKGVLSIHPDPLRHGIAEQISQIEDRLQRLESSHNT